MKKLLCCIMLFGLTALSAPAQTGQPASGAKDPLATYIRNQNRAVSGYLIRSAEMMPEENYGMRAGTQMEVRTFGQLLGHVINVNYMLCAMAKGEKNPNAVNFEKTPQTKASLTAAMKAAKDYCQPVFDTLTDASAMAMVTTTTPDGKTMQAIKAEHLLHNVIHDNEEYGNLVGYFRIKNIVPPSSVPVGK
jgi:uncharacterized damage-inducible protein DinB